MAILYDFVPDSTRKAYPPDELDPKAIELLSSKVPDSWMSGPTKDALAKALAQRMPRLTTVHQVGRRWRLAHKGKLPKEYQLEEGPPPPDVGPFSAHAEEPSFRAPTEEERLREFKTQHYKTMPRGTKYALRLLQDYKHGLTGISELIDKTSGPAGGDFTYGEPEGPVEKMFGLVGGAAGFATSVALTRKLALLSKLPGATDWATRLGFAVAGAHGETAKERLVGAGTTVLAGDLSHVGGQWIASRVARQMMGPAGKAGAARAYQAARNLGQGRLRAGMTVMGAEAASAPIAAKGAGILSSSASFGVFQPVADAYLKAKVTGQEFKAPTLPEMAESFTGMLFLNMLGVKGMINEARQPAAPTVAGFPDRQGRIVEVGSVQGRTPEHLTIIEKVGNSLPVGLPRDSYHNVFSHIDTNGLSNRQVKKIATLLRKAAMDGVSYTAPPKPGPQDSWSAQVVGARASERLSKAVVGKAIRFNIGGEESPPLLVVKADVYPFIDEPYQVRLVVVDTRTGGMWPLNFKNPTELIAQIGGARELVAKVEGAAPVAAPETEVGKPSPDQVPPSPPVVEEPAKPAPKKRIPPGALLVNGDLALRRKNGEVVPMGIIPTDRLVNTYNNALAAANPQAETILAELQHRIWSRANNEGDPPADFLRDIIARNGGRLVVPEVRDVRPLRPQPKPAAEEPHRVRPKPVEETAPPKPEEEPPPVGELTEPPTTPEPEGKPLVPIEDKRPRHALTGTYDSKRKGQQAVYAIAKKLPGSEPRLREKDGKYWIDVLDEVAPLKGERKKSKETKPKGPSEEPPAAGEVAVKPKKPKGPKGPKAGAAEVKPLPQVELEIPGMRQGPHSPEDAWKAERLLRQADRMVNYAYKIEDDARNQNKGKLTPADEAEIKALMDGARELARQADELRGIPPEPPKTEAPPPPEPTPPTPESGKDQKPLGASVVAFAKVEREIEKATPSECYRNAIKYGMNQPAGAEVVFGSVGAEGKRIDHAWVEVGDEVHDPTAGVVVKKSEYYEKMRVQEHNRYDAAEATARAVREKNWGPWEKPKPAVAPEPARPTAEEGRGEQPKGKAEESKAPGEGGKKTKVDLADLLDQAREIARGTTIALGRGSVEEQIVGLGVKKTHVRAVVDAAHVDPEVARSFLRGQKIGGPLHRAAATLGKLIRSGKVPTVAGDKAIQHDIMRHSSEGKILGDGEAKDFVTSYERANQAVKAALRPEKAAQRLEVGDWHRSVGRIQRRYRQLIDVLRAAAKDKKAAGEAAAEIKKVAEAARKARLFGLIAEHGDGTFTFSDKPILDAMVSGVRKGVSPQLVAESLQKQMELVLGEEGPLDWVKNERGFISPDMLGLPMAVRRIKALRAAQNIRAAFRAWRNTLRRRDRYNTLTDAHGNVGDREEVFYDMDVYSESAAYRLAAMIGHGQSQLPGELMREFVASEEKRSAMINLMMGVYERLFPKEQRAYLAAFYPGSRRAFRALEALPVKRGALTYGPTGRRPVRMPRGMEDIPAKGRVMYRYIRALINAEHRKLGLPPVRSRQFYAPHTMLEELANDLTKTVQEVMGRDLTPAEANRFVHRHLLPREGFERYREDFTMSAQIYFHATARYLAFLRFMRKSERWVLANKDSNPNRVAFVQAFLQNNLFKEKGRIESFLDHVAQRLVYERTDPALNELSPELAAASVGANARTFRQMGGKFYGAEEGRPLRATSSNATILVVGHKNRRTYYWVDSGQLMPRYGPKLNRISSWILKKRAKAMVWARKKLNMLDPSYNYATHLDAAEAQLNARAVDVYNDPVKALSELLGGRMVRALLAHNYVALVQNAGNNLLTTTPEYGFMNAAAGMLRGAKAIGQRTKMGIINLKEKSGAITPAEAQARRERTRVSPDAVTTEAVGALQSEGLRGEYALREEMAAATTGPLFMFRKLREWVLGGMAGYGGVEDITRGFDTMAAMSVAGRMGLSAPQAQRFYDATRGSLVRARADIARDITNTRTQASFASQMYPITMFDYGALGGIKVHGAPLGSMLMRLTKFPINYLLNYEIRPLQGFGTVTMAAVRGMLRAMTGGRIGYKAPSSGSFGRTRGGGVDVQSLSHFPTPEQVHAKDRVLGRQRAALDRWLEKGGAGYFQRHAMQVFVNQVAMIGFLSALSEISKINFLVFGMPGWGVALTALLGAIDKDHRDFWKRQFTRAKYAGVVNYARSAVPMGPMATLIWQTLQGFQGAFRAWEKGPGEFGRQVGKSGLNTGAELIRQQLFKALTAQRRFIQTNPEIAAAGDRVLAPFGTNTFDLYGIKSYFKDLTPWERFAVNVGIMDIPKREEARVQVKRERARTKMPVLTSEPSGGDFYESQGYAP